MTEEFVTVYSKYNDLLSPCSRKVADILIQRKRAIAIRDNAIKIILDKKDLKKMRQKILKRDNRMCFYCGKNIPIYQTATIDHLVPRTIDSNGNCGYDTEENMVCCCYDCNNHKGSMHFGEYIVYRYCILIAYLKTKIKNNI